MHLTGFKHAVPWPQPGPVRKLEFCLRENSTSGPGPGL